MCGIGGILRTDGESIAHTRLDAIEAAVAHRGPDGAGRFRDRVEIDDPGAGRRIVEVALVHRRLSIIDHEGGGQPMVSERGRGEGEGLVAVVFNGCIYNHRDLRRELESRGHRFRTDHSDTEVLLHGHREWGDELREHLEGMYAYAIWDRAAATLTLARDRFGEKPLYVRRGARAGDGGGDVVEFASARGGLGGLGGLGDEGVSEDALVRYLRAGCGWGAVIEPGFAGVAGVARLAPGDVVSFGPDGDRRRPRPPLPDPVQTTLTPDGIEPLLETAVATRLEADVPLGCFLSGGVDSSLIALYAQRHRPDLRTFSVRMPDARYDESAHAERVARHLGTDHTTLDVAMSPAEDLVRLVDRLGQPFADSSILPTYWVSRAARAHVKVALSGDSGDELFIGYERYAAAAALARHRGWLRRLPRALHRGAHPKSLRSKLARLGDMARDHARLGIAAMESIFTETQIAALLDAPPPAPAAPDDTGLHPVDALRRHDVLHYLPDDLLTKVDTASMAVALEVRCPFLDRDLAGAALATPARVLAPGGRRKGLLRDLARRHLPADVVDRPKMGFAIPIGEWFRSDHGGLRTLLGDHLSARNPFVAFDLDRAAVARLLDEHLAGRRDHTHRLFALLTLSMWAGFVTHATGTVGAHRARGAVDWLLMKKKKTNLLTVLIVLGLLAGVVVGEILFQSDDVVVTTAHWSKVAGDIVLIRPLKLMIVPIVFVSVIVGVTSIGNPSKLGVLGGSTVLYYLVTMLVAVTIGTTLVSNVKPGVLDEETSLALRADAGDSYEESVVAGAIDEAEQAKRTSLGRAFVGLLEQLIPSNIVKEMVEGRTLPIIVFALMLGLALSAGGEVTLPAIRFFEALFDAIMRLVLIIIWVTPLGVFLLMIYTTGSIGLDNLIGPISKYIFVVLTGLAIHGFIVLPVVLMLFTRRNPYRFMWQMRKALMTAFGTDSSSATLPVTIETAEHEGGCSKRAANFVLPLGSTVNMDGTALYEAVAVVFLFQLYGIQLGFAELLVVVITATLAAVGTAGVPSAGLIMMVIVIKAVNTSLGDPDRELPLESIGVIIGVDRIVDMCRTTVNVWGDAVGAKIMTRIAPDTPDETATAAATS